MFQLVCWTGNWNDRKCSVLVQPFLVCCREEEEEVEEEVEGGDMTGRLGWRTALVELTREAGVVVVSRLKQLD